MGRNLVILCDGTANEFGDVNTSIVRLAEILDRDENRQMFFYDPGVGTLPEPGRLSWLSRTWSKLMGLAFGYGLEQNVAEAYEYLMDFWRPDDRVFVFGFSRGAYTARVLAGLLWSVGLLSRGQRGLVPYIMKLYRDVPRQDAENYWRRVAMFRSAFAREVPDHKDRRFPVHFVGVFDTVSSVGWVWDPQSYPFTAGNPGVGVVRHAVAMDERRHFYRQNLFGTVDGQDRSECWFPGVHSDVGGGYPESQGGLWRAPFEWMVREAKQAGMLVDQARYDKVMARTPASERPWTDKQHESLKWYWWPAEFFPKMRYYKEYGRRLPSFGFGRHRTIHEGALLHRSVLQRLADAPYAPRGLTSRYRDDLRGKDIGEDPSPYQP